MRSKLKSSNAHISGNQLFLSLRKERMSNHSSLFCLGIKANGKNPNTRNIKILLPGKTLPYKNLGKFHSGLQGTSFSNGSLFKRKRSNEMRAMNYAKK
ncbi:hypothetical protein TNCT_650781 [Trichonephila clavata]|uniref:Uncharacterized protein n=1 Tax=Trichonephila clavata TaxID=2740835 RepID=A0A8X6FVF2_TRICU|nr:hypothetical protein TNCT_650781 [Trichonephila clavata]